MRKLYRFGILLTAATDLLLGFASLNSRRKSSLSMKVNQFKIEKKSSEDNVRLKRLWGLQEDEEGTWRSLRFVWVLGRRLLLPSSGFASGEIEIKIEVREVLQTKRRRERERDLWSVLVASDLVWPPFIESGGWGNEESFETRTESVGASCFLPWFLLFKCLRYNKLKNNNFGF